MQGNYTVGDDSQGPRSSALCGTERLHAASTAWTPLVLTTEGKAYMTTTTTPTSGPARGGIAFPYGTRSLIAPCRCRWGLEICWSLYGVGATQASKSDHVGATQASSRCNAGDGQHHQHPYTRPVVGGVERQSLAASNKPKNRRAAVLVHEPSIISSDAHSANQAHQCLTLPLLYNASSFTPPSDNHPRPDKPFYYRSWPAR